MKVAIISDYCGPCPPIGYGGSVFYWGLADTLGKMGHEIHLLAPEGSKCPTNGFLHIIEGTTQGRLDYGVEARAEEKYHNLLMEVNVVHDCSMVHIAAERLRHLYSRRNLVNTINGRTYYLPRPPFCVVTGSKVWQEEALKYGVKSEMVYWGIDTTFYCPDNSSRGDWYLWLARFHPDKGLDLALDLAEEMGFNLKVAGSMEFLDHAEYGRKYLKRIERLPTVEYVPLPLDETHHERKRDLYRQAKGFLYPVNYFECFGMVVVEAMACGCPVITSDKGAMPELVEMGCGYICEDREGFKRVLESDFNKTWEQYTVPQAHKFSWGRAAIEYEQLYRRVIEGYQW